MRFKLFKLPEWAKVIVVIALAIGFCVGVISLSLMGIISSISGENVESKAFSGPASAYVAKIRVVGEIGGNASRFASSETAYHHRWTIQTIDTLIRDSNNKGICLWLETPGGAVYETDELYLKLMEYKEKTGRPIYAYMRKLAASGGYYASAAADEIFANRNTWTGSIGVTLGTLFDVSGFLEKHGVRTDTIASGENKAMGSYYTPLTDEQRAIYQSLVDDSYNRFVAIVAEGRGMTDKEARELADGRIFTAGQALEAGLIDGILGEVEAEDLFRTKFDEGTIIFECYYRPDTNYIPIFGSYSGGILGLFEYLRDGDADTLYKGDVAAVLELAREHEESGMPPLKNLYTG